MNRPNDLAQSLHIPDTQSASDARHLAIQRVGIKSLRYPLKLSIGQEVQHTVATWALDVALPAEKKGTHMSRFVAWLDELNLSETALDAPGLLRAHAQMLLRLSAGEGCSEAAFRWFIRKRAPVSGVQSLLDYEGRFSVQTLSGQTRLWMQVAVPVKSLCPCSKEISDYGAHNQRSEVTLKVEVKPGQALSWHELVRFAEDAASSELWPMLKRTDEKWVTERAYENPKFVEDLVRDVALALNADARVGAYVVEVENFESIHNHSAYARVERA
jgi:GTP cyclohydrolase IB